MRRLPPATGAGSGLGKHGFRLLALCVAASMPCAAESLKAGYGIAPPMMYRDASGRAHGFAVEVLNEAARRNGTALEWVFVEAKSPAEMLRRREIDLLATGIITPERKREFFVSEPWWGGEEIALTPAGGLIRREADLTGRRIAVTTAGASSVQDFHPAEVTVGRSAREATEAVCAGRADAAILAGVFIRELLSAMPDACRGIGLRTIDLSQQWEYALIAHPEVAGAARQLRSQIADITLDGTLSRLAAANPPVSTPHATRLAELLRARYERRVFYFALAGAGALLVLVSAFMIRLNASQRRLRLANAELQRSIESRDLAEARRAQLERQLLQSQKLEAIGSLAGGVAHDFNNLLTVINGFSALALKSLPPEHSAHRQIEEVIRAGERAAGLTRQLLAFSRQQELAPRVVLLESIVAGLQKMLRRLIGEDIELSIRNGESGKIKADPGQIEQVVMNLVVNARDAMQHGGALTVATSGRTVAPDHPEIPAGMYAELTVSDTGPGIDPEVQSRIFEPFFTTKEQGSGTGLGLSTVYGIVNQSGGYVEVESRPGEGTRFHVLFPLCSGEVEADELIQEDKPWKGTETILLVEDEDAVRVVAREALQSRGYRILEASSAADAVFICEKLAAGELDLLLTDVVMPRMNGVELSERVLRMQPEARVLFMTGYVDRKLVERGSFGSKAACLQKPYSPSGLAREVRRVLDTPV